MVTWRWAGRVLPTLCGLAAVHAVPSAALAQADNLEQCAQAATDAMRSVGARTADEPRVGFLLEGESGSFPFVLEQDGCVGILAVGHLGVRDLDLLLYTETGMVVGQDLETDSRPYVRFCGAAQLRLIVTVHMYAGRGEFRLLRFANAPERLPDLNRTLGGCFAGASGVRRPPPDVGPEPQARPAEDNLAAIEARLASVGYRPEGEVHAGTLGAQQRQVAPMRFEADTCYAVALAGGPGTLDLDLHVRAPDGRDVSRDSDRSRDALARFCAPVTGTYQVIVQMSLGTGTYALRAHVAPRPPPPLPTGVAGHARLAYSETWARMGARGMHARPLAWGHLSPAQVLAMPVELSGGSCYAIAGVPADELRRGDLDLLLVDDEDGLVAWDLGRDSAPMLFHCPTATGRFRVVGRVYGAVGRYLVVIGEEGAQTP